MSTLTHAAPIKARPAVDVLSLVDHFLHAHREAEDLRANLTREQVVGADYLTDALELWHGLACDRYAKVLDAGGLLFINADLHEELHDLYGAAPRAWGAVPTGTCDWSKGRAA